MIRMKAACLLYASEISRIDVPAQLYPLSPLVKPFECDLEDLCVLKTAHMDKNVVTITRVGYFITWSLPYDMSVAATVFKMVLNITCLESDRTIVWDRQGHLTKMVIKFEDMGFEARFGCTSV